MTKFFSLLSLVNGIAPILAPIIGAFVLLFAPWKGVFIILSLIGVVMFLLVLFSLQNRYQLNHDQQEGLPRPLGRLSNLF